MHVVRSTVYKSHVRLDWKSRRWYTKVALIAGGVAVGWTALAIAIVIAVSLADVGEPGSAELTPTTGQESAPESTTTSATSPSTTPTTTSPENPPRTTGGQSTEAEACDNLPESTYSNACHDSYVICAATAKAKVQAYYSGNGATLDTIATRHAKDTYGTGLSGSFQGGYAGCFAALMDEYGRLYGGG